MLYPIPSPTVYNLDLILLPSVFMLYSNSSLFEITLTTFPTIFWVTHIYWVGLKGAVKMIFELDPFATLFYLFGNRNGKIFTSVRYVMLLLG